MSSLSSMTGYARDEGRIEGFGWGWELRSVNGRGLELRFRLPPGLDAIEAGLRERAAQALRRGNVTANLTLARPEPSRLAPDAAALEQALAAAMALVERIPGAPPPRAEALLALPGVLRPTGTETATLPADAPAAVGASFASALDRLVAARREEGARLLLILDVLLDEIAALHARAGTEAAEQPALQRARMLETVRGLLAEVPQLPEERIAQEVALLAARSDVREELDRLAAHLDAARALMAEGANVGRRLDFLVQEFNREANTLCSKSASIALTATGLALKAAIERLREQVQNIE